MRGALIAVIVLVLAVASLGAGYAVGDSTSHTETTTSTSTTLSTSTLTEVSTTTSTVTEVWTVINQNATYTGPGCPPPSPVLMALRIPCITYTPSSSWNVALLEYNGKYYYSTMETVASEITGASTTYTVWFDNSTAYCVSPYLAVSELPTCPPP